MLSSLPVSLMVGTLLGFLAAMGVGGGSLLILWLTLVLGFSQSDARAVNLLFFIPAAAISSCFRMRQGTLHWRTVLPGIGVGCVCAAVSTILSRNADLNLLRKGFGCLLLFTAVRELLYKPKGRNP